MGIESDARFWDRTSRTYAEGAIADQAGYERTLERTRAVLGSGDQVLELGCGKGTTALRLAGDVQGGPPFPIVMNNVNVIKPINRRYLK